MKDQEVSDILVVYSDIPLMSIQKNLLFIPLLVILLIGAYFIFFQTKEVPSEEIPEETLPTTPIVSDPLPVVPETPPEEEKKIIPEELTLQVPFTPQAPNANWDILHDEACEEASAIIANAFFKGDTRPLLPPAEVESEITKLTKWQQENFGYYLSIDSEETANMISEVYGLQAEVLREFSEDSLKALLAEEKLVLVPANGRALGNQNFTPPGPIYHMVVLTGYTKDAFIVNDPGTKRGKDYQYTYGTIRGAVGDYVHSQKKTDPTKPAIIVVSK